MTQSLKSRNERWKEEDQELWKRRASRVLEGDGETSSDALNGCFEICFALILSRSI